MSAISEPSDSLLDLLTEELKTFGDVPYPLLSYQIDAFLSYYNILQEDDATLVKRQKQRRSERNKLRNLMMDIFVGVGAEVFLLCTLAVPASRLNTETPRQLIPRLRSWWKAAWRPSGLISVASEICESYSINTLISSLRKRKISRPVPVIDETIPGMPTSENSSPQQHKRRKFSEDSIALLSPGWLEAPQNHTAAGREKRTESAMVSLTANSWTEAIPGSSSEICTSISSHTTSDSSNAAHAPNGPVLDLEFSDLLDFFQQYKASPAKLRMKCPYIGVPPPYIDIDLVSTLGLSGRLQFSLRLSELLIQSVLKSRDMKDPAS